MRPVATCRWSMICVYVCQFYVCLLVSSLQPWAVLKRLSQSSCLLGCRLACAQASMCYVEVRIPPQKKEHLGGNCRPNVKYRNIWRGPKLFASWQQRCGIWLPVLQQLVIESVMHGQCDTRPTIISCIDSLVASGRAVRIGYYNSDIIDVNKVFFTF